MKETDLMLLDWVLWKNRYVQIVRTCSVVYSFGHRDVWLAHCNDDNVVECHDMSKISPIPLTPEILEKNGWLNDPYSRLSLQDGKWLEFYWHEHRLQKYWEGTDEWQNHTKQLELVFKAGSIFYVHELQHALRLCGLNEFADNFKV